MATETPAAERPEAHLRALLGALFLFLALVGFVHGCGTDDLVFPGEFPFTPTSQFTNTPAPTADLNDVDTDLDEDDEF